jgi:serine protease AprX
MSSANLLNVRRIVMRKIISFTLLLTIINLTFQIQVINAQEPAQTEQGETVLNSATVVLPLSGVTFTETKILDLKKGTLTGRAVDRNGRLVSAEKLRAEEARLYREKYGKLQPDVYEAVQKRSGSDKIAVGFALNIPGLPDEKDSIRTKSKLSLTELRAISERRNRAVDAAVRKVAAPLIEHLARMNRLPREFDKERSVSPVISATVTIEELKELIKRDEILTVFLEEQKLVPYLNSSAKTMNVPSVWANGVMGYGTRVSVVEGGRVNFSNPYLAASNWATFDTSRPFDPHATSVAGIIASRPFTTGGLQHQGMIPSGLIYSANGDYNSNAIMHSVMDAGANNGDISNYSWGASCGNGNMDSFTWHADFIGSTKNHLIISAAGNAGNNPPCNRVSAAALGYNTLAVGSYNDQKTGLNLLDDLMSTFSTYGNPLYGSPADIEKPDVSAPGEKITTTTNSPPWFSMNTTTNPSPSGTSMSSPMVAGVNALITQVVTYQPRRAAVYKAIILASAVHNIEGVAQLSSKDGAGGVDAKVAYETAVNGRYLGQNLNMGTFQGNNYFDLNIGHIPAGRRVKVAVVWTSNSSGQNGPDPLGVDLDLTILDPQMNVVAVDGRWSDSKELAQFYTTPTSPGSYKIRVYLYSWNQTINQYPGVGIAWSIS